MLEVLLAPYRDIGPLILRVVLGLIFLYHGWPKLNPNSPIKGVAGFAGFLTQMRIPLPLFFGWVVALLETVGAVLLIVGLATRILAILAAIEMLVAILVAKRGFMKVGFMSQQTTGWEFDFALLAGFLALLFTGSGRWALDAVIGL